MALEMFEGPFVMLICVALISFMSGFSLREMSRGFNPRTAMMTFAAGLSLMIYYRTVDTWFFIIVVGIILMLVLIKAPGSVGNE